MLKKRGNELGEGFVGMSGSLQLISRVLNTVWGDERTVNKLLSGGGLLVGTLE